MSKLEQIENEINMVRNDFLQYTILAEKTIESMYELITVMQNRLDKLENINRRRQ